MTALVELTASISPIVAGTKGKLYGRVWLGAALLSVGVALVSYRYVAQVGPVSPTVAKNRFSQPWIVVHAAGAATALLLGPFQFGSFSGRHWFKFHRWTGRAYVAGCLVGGASGLVLAAGSSAGPVAQSGFSAVGVLWLYVTTQGWRNARAGRFSEHRRWMIRSFALTFAAVTLRIYLPIAVASGFSLNGAYQVVSWLCWVPNAALAEFYLRTAGASSAVGAITSTFPAEPERRRA